MELLNFGVRVPTSTTPVTILFRFFRNYPSNTTLTLEYMNIFAVLRPVAATFDIGDLTVIPTPNSIGTKSIYVFRVNISQPLSTASYILINLPLELDITQFTNSSTCTIQSIDANTNAVCSIYDVANKVIQVSINAVNGVSAPQLLNITIGDIINADNP